MFGFKERKYYVCMEEIKDGYRIEWHEDREGAADPERFFVVAEYDRAVDEWKISERSSWECAWFAPHPKDLPRLRQEIWHRYCDAHPRHE